MVIFTSFISENINKVLIISQFEKKDKPLARFIKKVREKIEINL